MNDAQFTAWLKSPAALRVVLVEATAQVGGVETTLYMATRPYNTAPSDVPANTSYQPIVKVGVLFTETLSLSGDGALSAGDVEVDNYAGERDDWLGHVWTNRPFRAYIGDVRWPRADFRPIFNGIVADIAPRGRDKLALKLRDKLQRLNAPISEAKLGGDSHNKDALLPVALGEVHNITPLLVDEATLRYQVHCGPVESTFEVRDNAIPINVVVDNAKGTFTLPNASFGTVTASVQGDKPGTYANTVAQLVRRLATGFGKESDRFGTDDLDAANLAAFDAAHPAPVGLYASDRMNVLAACQDLAGSVGAQLSMSRLGKLRLIRLALPAPGAPFVVGPEHMIERSLVQTGRTDAVAAVKLGFDKNWTVQEGLTTTIPEEHKVLFAQEWVTTTKVDDAIRSTYRLNAEPVQQDTMLLRRIDADVEAQRRLDLWKAPRATYEFEGLPELLQLELGQAITVYHQRYGMQDGLSGMVTSLAPDWQTGRVKVGFIA